MEELLFHEVCCDTPDGCRKQDGLEMSDQPEQSTPPSTAKFHSLTL
jgi:hypothetical protein